MNSILALSQPVAGLKITVSDDALSARKDCLELAQSVTEISRSAQLHDAVAALSLLKERQRAMEETRVAVKAPVLEAGKAIDAAAKAYSGALALEQARIQKLADTYQAKVEAEADALRQDELRKLTEEAQIKTSEDDMRDRALRRNELETKLTVVGASVRQGWDYDVVDIQELAKWNPSLVKIEPRRAEILAMLNQFHEEGQTIPGLVVRKSVKVQAK